MQQIDDMTREQLWYLIGEECIKLRRAGITRHEANQQLGLKYGCSADAVGHRERYTKAIDRIRVAAPDGADALLSGKIALSVDKTILLSKREDQGHP